ncbi:unnamed protein product [Diplocarpon coronariae]
MLSSQLKLQNKELQVIGISGIEPEAGLEPATLRLSDSFGELHYVGSQDPGKSLGPRRFHSIAEAPLYAYTSPVPTALCTRDGIFYRGFNLYDVKSWTHQHFIYAVVQMAMKRHRLGRDAQERKRKRMALESRKYGSSLNSARH